MPHSIGQSWIVQAEAVFRRDLQLHARTIRRRLEDQQRLSQDGYPTTSLHGSGVASDMSRPRFRTEGLINHIQRTRHLPLNFSSRTIFSEPVKPKLKFKIVERDE